MAALGDIIGYGLASARPAAGIPGRLYYASDTDALSRDNGSTWDALAPGGAGGTSAAEDVTYDNATSGLTATDVQAAIDEVAASGGGGSGSLTLIEEWLPADGNQSHDFTIPGTVATIEYEVAGRGKAAAQFAEVAIRINGDTGANYGVQRIYNDSATTVVAGNATGQTSGAVGYLPGASATAGKTGQITGQIQRAQGAVQHAWTGQEFREDTALNAGVVTGRHTGTSAITSLTIRASDANGFAVGTVVRVYGRLT